MEYKFRAFIPQLNIMIYGVDVYANGTIGMISDKVKLPADYYIDWDSSCIMQANPDENGSDYHVMNFLQGEEYIWFEEGKYTLMQYTGLKDKNGVEIYTGDVLSVKPHNANYPIKYVVLFNDKLAFMMRFIDRYKRKESSFYDELLDSAKYSIFEVIGSIHTHPELLNAK